MRALPFPEPPPDLDKIAWDIIGAAIEVHRALGPGHIESVYENAISIELTNRRIPHERQKEFCVDYQGATVGVGRLDLLVEDQVIVELKAVERINAVVLSQVMWYLKATGHRLALILNFRVAVMRDGIKRVVWM